MQKVDSLNDSANQALRVQLVDQSVVALEIKYRPAIERWSMKVTYGTFEVENLILCFHPNILRQYRNLIPFGIACRTTDGADPVFIGDFNNGRAELYVLEQADVERIETSIFGVTE